MLKKLWQHLEEYILLPMLVVSVTIIFIQVIMRYVFANSLSWTEELARFLYIWEVWLGISFATRTKAHLRITLIFNLIKGKAEWIIRFIVNIVWFGFGVFVIVLGAQTTMKIAGFGQVSSALQIPMQYIYCAIPIGATLMNIRLIEETFGMLKQLRTGEGGANQDV